MQTLESAGLSAAVALALVSLAEIRSSRPAYIAGFFFLFCAILNGAAYTGNKYTGDAVEMYFLGAACNLILMIALMTSKEIKVEMLLMSACFALLSTQYVLMAIDEYASLGEKTWLWSWSYQFRASSDVIIAALGVISAIRNKGL
ncbi:MAG: hypothetical protein ACRDC6_33090 [Shewanella sp.]